MENKFNELKEVVIKNNYGELIEDVDLSIYTSLRIGGRAKYLYYPNSLTSLHMVYQFILNNQLPYYVIGNGTNLLINNRYFEMIFINLKNLNHYKILPSNRYMVEAGVNASKLSIHLAKIGFTKIEFMSVIPGSIGGLIYMNAGAYHKAMEDIIESVIFLNELGKVKIYSNKQCMFDYRSSIFKKEKGIIIGCIIKLECAKEVKAPISKIKNYIESKKNNQPVNCYNAGSTFKNLDNLSAWKVIDSLGLRGFIVGGAKVSEKHANFLINFQNASYDDMLSLITIIQKQALEKQNIILECEWELLQ